MKNSQVPVKGTLQNDPSSRVTQGQVPVHSTTEGDRRGNTTDRGCVSPLGKADLGYTNYPHGGPVDGKYGKGGSEPVRYVKRSTPGIAL